MSCQNENLDCMYCHIFICKLFLNINYIIIKTIPEKCELQPRNRVGLSLHECVTDS